MLLYDLLGSGHGKVPASVTERQRAMRDFVLVTGLQDVRIKTFVPIQQWRSKLKTFPYPTDGLVFVPATRTSYKTEQKFKWKVCMIRGATGRWAVVVVGRVYFGNQ